MLVHGCKFQTKAPQSFLEGNMEIRYQRESFGTAQEVYTHTGGATKLMSPTSARWKTSAGVLVTLVPKAREVGASKVDLF